MTTIVEEPIADIVWRLRTCNRTPALTPANGLVAEAADEIERLRAKIVVLEAENAALTAALANKDEPE